MVPRGNWRGWLWKTCLNRRKWCDFHRKTFEYFTIRNYFRSTPIPFLNFLYKIFTFTYDFVLFFNLIFTFAAIPMVIKDKVAWNNPVVLKQECLKKNKNNRLLPGNKDFLNMKFFPVYIIVLVVVILGSSWERRKLCAGYKGIQAFLSSGKGFFL